MKRRAETNGGMEVTGIEDAMTTTTIDQDSSATVMIDPNELWTGEPFSILFPIDSKIQEAIEATMRKAGYGKFDPVKVWRDKNILIDGHTRRLAAMNVGIPIKVTYFDFEDEDEAFYYAVSNQRDRRNLKDPDEVRLVEIVDERESKGGNRGNQYTTEKSGKVTLETLPGQNNNLGDSNKKKSAQKTADVVKISRGKVEKIRAVLDAKEEYPEITEAVKSGELSINKGSTEVRTRNRAKRNAAKIVECKPPKIVPAEDDPIIKSESPEPSDSISEIENPNLKRWLSLPIRGRVVSHEYDEAVKLYAASQSTFDRLEEIYNQVIGRRSLSHLQPFMRDILSLAWTVPPNQWEECKKCNGRGSCPLKCPTCGGTGFRIPKKHGATKR